MQVSSFCYDIIHISGRAFFKENSVQILKNFLFLKLEGSIYVRWLLAVLVKNFPAEVSNFSNGIFVIYFIYCSLNPNDDLKILCVVKGESSKFTQRVFDYNFLKYTIWSIIVAAFLKSVDGGKYPQRIR